MNFENYIFLTLGAAIGFFAGLFIRGAYEKTDAENRLERHLYDHPELDEHEREL